MNKKVICLSLSVYLASAACVFPAFAAPVPDGTNSSGETYTASQTDESAVDVSGEAEVTIRNAEVLKSGGDASSADAASFQGVNSAVRAYDQAKLTISDSVITASASNATGVFACDDAVIDISSCEIEVTGGGAGGIQVAGGGTLIGTDLTVSSSSKAAIRSDRGGGVMTIDGGTYTSTGKNGCPAIYSTADITVKNAVCSSTQSRAVIIEGKNSVALENVVIDGNDQSTKEGSVKANVLLYQSTSGDADEGTGIFSMTGGEMTCSSGAMFYCTNTDSVINLENAALNLSEDGSLLIVSEGRWGKDGRNGGNCVLNAASQELEGSILVDEISSLELNLTASSFTGSITGDGAVTVTLDQDSTWTLTGDSHIDELIGDMEQIDLNGYELTIE